MIQSFCVFICLLWRTCHFNSAGKRICITQTPHNTAVQRSRNRIKVWNEQFMHVAPLWPNEHSKMYCLGPFAQNSQSRGQERTSYTLTLGSSLNMLSLQISLWFVRVYTVILYSQSTDGITLDPVCQHLSTKTGWGCIVCFTHYENWSLSKVELYLLASAYQRKKR